MSSRNYIFTFSRKQVNVLASIVRPLSQNLKLEGSGRGNVIFFLILASFSTSRLLENWVYGVKQFYIQTRLCGTDRVVVYTRFVFLSVGYFYYCIQ